MVRRPRIDLAGFHHVINRGVNRSNIFTKDEDYEVFLRIVDKACFEHKVILHDYCLMTNHFHIMIETALDNRTKSHRSWYGWIDFGYGTVH